MIRMTILASTALAVAIAFSPAQAASVLGPGAQPAAANLVHSIKTKRKEGKIKKMMHKIAKKMNGYRRHARGGRPHMAMSHGGCKQRSCTARAASAWMRAISKIALQICRRPVCSGPDSHVTKLTPARDDC